MKLFSSIIYETATFSTFSQTYRTKFNKLFWIIRENHESFNHLRTSCFLVPAHTQKLKSCFRNTFSQKWLQASFILAICGVLALLRNHLKLKKSVGIYLLESHKYHKKQSPSLTFRKNMYLKWITKCSPL